MNRNLVQTVTIFLAAVVFAIVGGASFAGTSDHPQTYWMKRNCYPNHHTHVQVDPKFNCFDPYGEDGGSHAHYRYRMGNVLCVMFVGTRQYKQNHDYCILNGKQVTH